MAKRNERKGKKKISKRDSRDEKKGYDTLIKIYKQTCIKNEDFICLICSPSSLTLFPFVPKYKSLAKKNTNITYRFVSASDELY